MTGTCGTGAGAGAIGGAAAEPRLDGGGGSGSEGGGGRNGGGGGPNGTGGGGGGGRIDGGMAGMARPTVGTAVGVAGAAQARLP
jgi:hypothetical protein